MNITELPNDIIKIIITKVEDFQDFNVYKNCYMAFYKYFNFDTSVVKQKIIEIEYHSLRDLKPKNTIFIFNGYYICNNIQKYYTNYDFLYYNNEIIGLNWLADRNKTEITYTIFREYYGNNINDNVLLYFTNNELSVSYEKYKNEYDIFETNTVLIRKDKPQINKAKYTYYLHFDE